MTRSVPDGNPAIFPGSPVNVSSPGAIAHKLRDADVEDLHASPASTNRFSGFRSRWTMPFSCAAASADELSGVVDRLRRR
jgi:hypothetical protein